MKTRIFSSKVLCSVLLIGITLSAAPTRILAESATAHASSSQKITVTGVVEDAEGPVIGASILEKGTSNGTVTDIDGNFTISVAPNATLVFCHIFTDIQIHSLPFIFK